MFGNRTSGALALAAFLLFAAIFGAATAGAAEHGPTARQVKRFWTPQRMAAARPLELTVGRDGNTDLHLGPSAKEARAGYSVVETPEVTPYAWNGRLYVKQGAKEGFCTATAIDSPSRSLVLTAGHCVNTGPRGNRPGIWSSYIEFVPGFNLGAAPFGAWVLSGKPRALRAWTQEGNPNFDLGAFLVEPNSEGVALADAVGGGATIVTDLDRRQSFETFGYPGGTERMRTCPSGFAGEDPVTATFAGPPTVGIHCRWAPGASGGAWMIDNGTEIDGITTYLRIDEKQRSFGPYFSSETVGRVVAGW
jgi:V8-like Glu-specific endopeptidase